MENKIKISVVIPIHNEEGNIPELHRRLVAVLDTLCREHFTGTGKQSEKNGHKKEARDYAERSSGHHYEIILVDDGSNDRSWQLIKELHGKDPRVTGMSFSRNFGHHIAISAGLDNARGEMVILMDGDLQDPPEEIPSLFEQFIEGYDLVYGIRQNRQDPFFKKATSYLFWFILRKFSGVDIPQGQTMLRIMSRRIVDVLSNMREQSRFVHGMMAWAGFNIKTVEIKHNPRTKGKSKYNVVKMFRLAFHAVTSFSTVPLRLATYIGLISSCISLLFGVYFIYKSYFLGIPVLGYASIIVSIFFVGGIQLLVLGILGEYIGRSYQEGQKRPLYVIAENLLYD